MNSDFHLVLKSFSNGTQRLVYVLLLFKHENKQIQTNLCN